MTESTLERMAQAAYEDLNNSLIARLMVPEPVVMYWQDEKPEIREAWTHAIREAILVQRKEEAAP